MGQSPRRVLGARSGPAGASPSISVQTPHGEARARLRPAAEPRAALILGHGAGGGVDARDLMAAADAALAAGVSVALVEQPYRVAGRRAPAPAHQLDAAWIAVVDRLKARELRGLALIAGGRSSGARVACRTAVATGAVAVLCLAFPLQPPRRPASAPGPSRLAELDAVSAPTLVIQGERDPFGMPPAGRSRTVVKVTGDHSLRSAAAAVAAEVAIWLPLALISV